MKNRLFKKVSQILSIMASVAVLMVFPGCSSVQYNGNSQLIGYTEYGQASYYAMKYQFSKTASGEYFNQLSLTGAHRTLPFGTNIKVTNLKNNRSVVVRVNDRGPFIAGRIIDLSRSAFSEIGNTDSGILDVKIEVIN
jgi:rare lipoprotein A